MSDDCKNEISCEKCSDKCEDYLGYVKDNKAKNLLQGEDRKPLFRKNGHLTNSKRG